MAMQKVNTAVILGAVAAAVTMIALVTASLVANQTVPNAGAVTSIAVNVYWDAGCTNTTSSIDWGYVDPGESKNLMIYLKNPGGTSEVLSMSTGNWSSSPAQSKISVSWNRQGYALARGAVVSGVLTLSVDPTISDVTEFTFDMTITGTQS
jgi:hypothetical protein